MLIWFKLLNSPRFVYISLSNEVQMLEINRRGEQYEQWRSRTLSTQVMSAYELSNNKNVHSSSFISLKLYGVVVELVHSSKKNFLPQMRVIKCRERKKEVGISYPYHSEICHQPRHLPSKHWIKSFTVPKGSTQKLISRRRKRGINYDLFCVNEFTNVIH